MSDVLCGELLSQFQSFLNSCPNEGGSFTGMLVPAHYFCILVFFRISTYRAGEILSGEPLQMCVRLGSVLQQIQIRSNFMLFGAGDHWDLQGNLR